MSKKMKSIKLACKVNTYSMRHVGKYSTDGNHVWLCRIYTIYITNDLKLVSFCMSRKMSIHSVHTSQMTWNISLHPPYITELLGMAHSSENNFKYMVSQKWMQVTNDMEHLSSLSPSLLFPILLSLSLSLTGSVWWWCHCLDLAAAYLHQSSQLDREEKDFPAQLCQWVSEIYPHKTLLDSKEAWG